MLNRNSILIFFCLLAVTCSSPVWAQESKLLEVPIYIDNEPFITKYIMRDGHLLVPALFLKHTGVKMNWNETYQSVVFTHKDIQFALPVGKDYLEDYGRATGMWRRKSLSTKTLEFNGETFVPLIDVVKKFGMDVVYDSKREKTFIKTNIPPAPNPVSKGDESKKQVALTFDDGPDEYYTAKILDILKQKNAPATFFVMGKQIEQFPEMMKRIVKEGHGIANHTYNHPALPTVMSETLVEEVRSTQKEMIRTVGRMPDLFRPPYGALTKSDRIVLSEMGLRTVMWSVDTIDWSGQSAEEILSIVRRDISPGGIILQHNFQSEARLLDGTVEALPQIIDELRAQGYQFVTVQTLLEHE
ncbi:polysaccharide deacetylase family protein [Alkalihalobacillus sp. MEB130]|uniref:polysaccharide deacetylase family protein n=1 Tax=Alkalihalobacillus sp. MEB130 TaxID=2976704 RepID=UPI0028DFA112|nr:polysaccharide deacetylase family protein [Alkalihalobacillus sp. MEB130]MDT8861613.1 polysaccharide deacetylase family protein [Alkalihalobacillus sp. MEB130]